MKTKPLTLRQWETLLSIAKRSGVKREPIDTHRYLFGTLTALERRGLITFVEHGFYVLTTAEGEALIAQDAEVIAERLSAQRDQIAWTHREALYKIIQAPKGALADEYSALGLEATHALLNAGLIETCMAGTPEGHYHGRGVGVGGVRLTEVGQVYWKKVEHWVIDPLLRKVTREEESR